MPNKTADADKARQWVSSMVIGLNLCPFAKAPFDNDTIHYVVTNVSQSEALVAELAVELKRLVATPRTQVETTLLILPNALKGFLDFNDFLGVAEDLVRDLDLEGIVQIVGFHPNYQFAGTEPDAPENYTNRSPQPMLHLLREESVSEVTGSPEEMGEISRRNIETLKRLGTPGILKRLASLT